jgi:hypothetical protein
MSTHAPELLYAGFGLKPTPDILSDRTPLAWWGARAIYRYDFKAPVGRRASVDLVWDRGQMEGAKKDRDVLSCWLDAVALPKLREELERLVILPNDEETVFLDSPNCRLWATPRKSHGYLYIGALVFEPVPDHDDNQRILGIMGIV